MISTAIGRFYRKQMSVLMRHYLRRFVVSVPNACMAEMLLPDRLGVHEFDNQVRALFAQLSLSRTPSQLCKYLGFRDGNEYYCSMSTTRYIAGLRTPLLALAALNDPVATWTALPFDTARRNPYLIIATTKHHGHLAHYSHLDPCCESCTTMPILEFLRLGAELQPTAAMYRHKNRRPILFRSGLSFSDPLRPDLGFVLLNVSTLS